MLFSDILLAFLFIYGAKVEPSSQLLRPFIGLLYQPRMVDGDECEAISGMKAGRGKQKYSEKTCPTDALSTTDPTWFDPGWNPDRRGGKPATYGLSYGTTFS
jgi:hypothetical protein